MVLEKKEVSPGLAKWGILFWGNVKILLLSQFQQFAVFQTWIQFSLPERSSMQPPHLPDACFGSSVTSLTTVSRVIVFLCYSFASTEINDRSFCLLANSCNIIIKFSAVPYLNQYRAKRSWQATFFLILILMTKLVPSSLTTDSKRQNCQVGGQICAIKQIRVCK